MENFHMSTKASETVVWDISTQKFSVYQK